MFAETVEVWKQSHVVDAESCKVVDNHFFVLVWNNNFRYVWLKECLFFKWIELPVMIIISVMRKYTMLCLYSLQRL